MLLGPAWPYRGGPARFMTYLYQALTGAFDVHFVNFRMMYPRLLFPGTTPLDKSKSEWTHVPGPRLLHSLHPWYWWRTAQHIRKTNPDLIVFDWYQPFFGPMYFAIGLFLPPWLRKRIFFITENVLSHESRGVDRFLTWLGLYWSRGFLALSSTVEKELKHLQPDKPIWRSELPIFEGYPIPPGLSKITAREKLNLHTTDKVLLFFGYIRHYKGLDILIDSMPDLLKADPGYRLLIAGECYEDPAIYHQQIERLEIAHVVIFENAYIPNEAVAEYFLAADAVVLPYRSATQSGILNMAYGFGRPVICTDAGGLGEFVEHERTGWIIPLADPEVLAKEIHQFFIGKDDTALLEAIHAKVASNGFDQIAGCFAEVMDHYHRAKA